MKVLHVLGELNPSGAETMLCVAAPSFAEKGVQAEILSTGVKIGSYAPQLTEAGYKLHHIPFSKSFRFFYNLFRLMRTRHYDVIHLHTERANFWIGLTALLARPHRTLRTIHSNFVFKGRLRLCRLVQRRLLSMFGLVHVSIGPSVKNNEHKTFYLKTLLVPNWYNDKSFLPITAASRKAARQKLSIPPDETVIVSIGNCSKIKNHEVIFRALAMLPQDSRPIYLHAGNEETGQPERKLAEEVGIADRVQFLGPLTDIRPALQAADIYIMPSLYEGFGIAAVEALAVGLPAIFTDVPGLRDFREHYDGLYYSKPDVSSLYAALSDALVEGREKRLARCQKYSDISHRLYGVEAGVCGYLEIYQG